MKLPKDIPPFKFIKTWAIDWEYPLARGIKKILGIFRKKSSDDDKKDPPNQWLGYT